MFGSGQVLKTMSALAMLAAFASILQGQESAPDLTTVSLESLMNMKVSSVSRRDEELRSSAAAIHVITQEDIRRSGATDIADLLRMVPGMDVARKDSSTWAISTRGFTAEYATKLLVMVDGRTVYDPTFSGVSWHLQNLVLEDIDRIEVIRGPGATMWGANAVNGVISIKTKRAADTQGGLLVADAGTNSPGEGTIRFGSSIGSHLFYRLYSRQTTRLAFDSPTGGPGGDAWNLTTVGTRLDWDPSKSNSVVFESEARRGVRGARQNFLTSISPITFGTVGLRSDEGGFAMARWSHIFKDKSSLTVQVYHDILHLKGNNGAKDLKINDFDFQHNFKIGGRNNVMWGVGKRDINDSFPTTLAFGMTPAQSHTDLNSAFVQDEISIVQDKVSLSIGSKFEDSSLAGGNFQPSIRISWLPNARQAIWVAVSRGVHSASRVERGMRVNFTAFETGSGPAAVDLLGQPGTRSEGLVAYEMGYRYQANRKLWLDATTFYNVYDHLSTDPPGAPYFATDPAPPHLVLPLFFQNNSKGEAYGGETSINYQLLRSLRVESSYSLLLMQLHSPTGDTSDSNIEGQTSRHQVRFESTYNVGKSLELSGQVHFASSLPYFAVPSYTRVDLKATWKGFENVELSVAGQNLLSPHFEFGDIPAPSNVTSRQIYAKVAWKF